MRLGSMMAIAGISLMGCGYERVYGTHEGFHVVAEVPKEDRSWCASIEVADIPYTFSVRGVERTEYHKVIAHDENEDGAFSGNEININGIPLDEAHAYYESINLGKPSMDRVWDIARPETLDSICRSMLGTQ